MNYKIKEKRIGRGSRLMAYKHYLPEKSLGQSAVVFICGRGHTMKVWEITPDGRKGWAPIFAENNREVITINWACGSPNIYKCSDSELCSLTQKDNMELIAKIIDKEIAQDIKIAFLGWSMGGPQALILATDIMPQRASAFLGYAATGPLNFYDPPKENEKQIDLGSPLKITPSEIDKLWLSPIFPKEYKKQYIKEYLVPCSPLMTAIHSKKDAVMDKWNILIVKKPERIPPTLLVNGDLDKRHAPAKEKLFIQWLKQYQKDITLKYVSGFSHLGMLSSGNEKIARIYIDWLNDRGI